MGQVIATLFAVVKGAKKSVMIGVAVLVLGAVSGGFFTLGQKLERGKLAARYERIMEQQKTEMQRQQALAEALDQEIVRQTQERIRLHAALKAAKHEREMVYRDRVSVIRNASGDCLDQPLPGNILDILRSETAGGDQAHADRSVSLEGLR